MKKLTKITLTIFVFCLSLFIAAILKTKAGDDDSASGWIWGASEDDSITGEIGVLDGNESGLGWVSLNCNSWVDNDGDDNPDEPLKVCNGGSNNRQACNGPAPVDCGEGDCVEACSVIDYGVNIPSGNGSVTGYAWSSNVGWIDFNPQDNCGDAYQADSCTPPSGSAGVYRSGNSLTGWARIVGVASESKFNNSGDWEGWMKMDGEGYGVSIDSFGILSGHAWNMEDSTSGGLGWFSFEEWPNLETIVIELEDSDGELITGYNPNTSFTIGSNTYYSQTENADDSFSEDGVWQVSKEYLTEALSPQYVAIPDPPDPSEVGFDDEDIIAYTVVDCSLTNKGSCRMVITYGSADETCFSPNKDDLKLSARVAQ